MSGFCLQRNSITFAMNYSTLKTNNGVPQLKVRRNKYWNNQNFQAFSRIPLLIMILSPIMPCNKIHADAWQASYPLFPLRHPLSYLLFSVLPIIGIQYSQELDSHCPALPCCTLLLIGCSLMNQKWRKRPLTIIFSLWM